MVSEQAANVPPQDSRVHLTFTAKEEAGRFAVAQRSLSPGELVLAAAPYGVVMNPKFCPSALYLSARCSNTTTAGSSTMSSTHAEGSREKAKHGKAPKKGSGKQDPKGESAGEAAAQFATSYKHALYGDATQHDAAGAAPPSSASGPAATRWYTTHSTWCSVCFHEIEAGRWLCNRGSLCELAVDVSCEQEAITAALQKAAAAAAASTHDDDNAAAGNEEGVEEDGEGDADDVHNAAALRKLKKPTKSAKMRKDGAVELRRRLLEKALAQREEIFYERRLQLRARAERGAPVIRQEGWEAFGLGDASASSADNLYDGAVSGCSGCGVLCYCSAACWRAHHAMHVESGECAVLRGLYPRLMTEYYSISSGGGGSASAALEQGGVVMPGDEPLHWSRSSSEAKMLEFQSLLFGAVVLARAARSGYAAHFTAAAAVQSSETDAVDERAGEADAAGEPEAEAEAAAVAGKTPVQPDAAPTISPATTTTTIISTKSATAAPTPHSVDSVVVPKEVSLIQETRRKAGLEGTVEVLDDDAALRSAALAGLAHSVPMECVHAVGPRSIASMRHSDMYTRQPRYADMAQMETNLSVISKPRRSTYQRYYRTFTKRVLPVLQLLPLLPDESERTNPEATLPLHVSELYFLRLCAAAQCNSFGVYDTQDSCIAFGMYPEASYFNHSCVPNLCRVMQHGGRLAAFYALRTIAPGEPLSISYTDVEQQNSAERRRNLLETYRFFCTCDRCSGQAEGPVMAVGSGKSGAAAAAAAAAMVVVSPALFEKPLLLCGQCSIRGYLRPIPDAPCVEAAVGTWTMAKVPVRACTMCGCRVVREAVEQV